MNFVIQDCENYILVPIFLGGPFLATRCVCIDMERGHRKFLLNNKEVNLNHCWSMKNESDIKVVNIVNHIVE